jgi:hypothetical protein
VSDVETTNVRAAIAPNSVRDATGHAHGHDLDAATVPANAEPMDGLERFTLHSAGVDVGSATSHLTISRLVLKRRGTELSG